MEKWELGWLVGLFEGEGTITFVDRASVRVSVGSTDEDVINTLYRLVPSGCTYRRELKNRIKPLYVWRLQDRDNVAQFLEVILPFLHSRRKARAIAALERLKDNHGEKRKRTHCLRGHPLSGENLYIARTTGWRSCKACRKIYDEARSR